MSITKLLKSLITIFVSSFMVTILFSSSVYAKETMYHIYGDAKPGTKFKEKLFSSYLPLDKPYAELSDKQKAYVRSPYEGMKETETPPFPSKGYGALIEPVIKAHSRVLRKGELVVIAMIGADGKTKSVEILSIPSPKMTDFVNALFFETEFDPATSDGKPCDMEYLLEIRTDVTYGNF